MAEENKAVINPTAAVGEQGVDGAGAPAAKTARELELEAELLRERELRAKETEEKENYKQGLLRAKGKKSAKPVDLTDPVSVTEHIKETVEDELLERKAQEDLQKEHAEAERLRNRNIELERIIKSGGTLPVLASSGSATVNDPKPKDPTAFWSEEDKNTLRARGMTEQAIKVAEERARTNNPWGEQGNFLGIKRPN